jgi:hypothetical protein
VFDRMFSLGVRGSGVDATPLAARTGAAAVPPPGLRRQFLYCNLKPETPAKSAAKTGVTAVKEKLARGSL